MADSELIRSFVDQYELEVNGVKFWTPYFVNKVQVHDDEKRPNMPAPHLGKGTPSELREAVLKALHQNGETPQSAEEYRKFMHDNLIGVECSGFAYYVYDKLLRLRFGTTIDEQLFWSRDELLLAYDKGIPWHKPDVNREDVEQYSDEIPLSDLAPKWGWKTPRLLVRAERFWREPSVNEVVNVEDLRVGDMIINRESTGSEIGHLLIVTSLDNGSIQYAHSSRLDGTIGGVHYAEIEITNPEKPIEAQIWEEQDFLATHNRYALRRLKVLDE